MAQRWAAEYIAALPDAQRAVARQSIDEFPNRVVAERFARQFLAGK
jgi:hypothetical protein